MADQPEPTQLQLFIKTLTGRTIPLNVKSTDSVLHVKELILKCDGIPVTQQRLVHATKILNDDDTLAAAGIQHESTVHLILSLRKPVIYLFSPRTLHASVRVRLSPQWNFSCVYPVVDIKQDGRRQAVEWDVEVRKDCLVDLATGNEEAYLFWEAQSNTQLLDSPAPSRPNSPAPIAFDPAHPLISASHSVVLSTKQIPAYLQKALTALSLHVEARTSFITYWLPEFQKHKHIALRFVPQQEYEQAAELKISPAPTVVTRVFMLFRGLSDEEAEACRPTSMRADGPNCWKDIVGIREDAADQTLFRVLEWGGMEV